MISNTLLPFLLMFLSPARTLLLESTKLITVNLKRNVPLCIGPETPLISLPITNCTLVTFDSDLLTLSHGQLSVRRPKVCLLSRPYIATIELKLLCKNVKKRKKFILKFVHPFLHSKKKSKQRRSLSSSDGIQFEKSEYQVNVTEETGANQLVVRVRAFNRDRLPLFYSMVAPEDTRSANLLRLDRSTGQINTVTKLDRETMDKHVLRVTAYERGNPTHSATATVIINVKDIQDHEPVFEKSVYTANVVEDAQIGTTVLHVYARDADSGINGQVTYSLVAEDGSPVPEFKIDIESGVIQVARKLDRESKDFYRFNVIAKDRAKNKPGIGEALVQISVLDANDHYPMFTQKIYTVTIPENIQIPYKVVRVEAVDFDDGENGQVRYSIVSGGDTFSIDYKTGEVTLIQGLNFKSSPVHELVIRAQDSGVPSHSNTTLVEITVQDVNDHAPKFYSSQIQVSVRENVPRGYTVTRVQAFDADSGLNAKIHYELDIPKELKKDWPFEINSQNGWIKTITTLDREKQSLFDFSILAIDSGIPPQSSSVPISITVTDENDNQPIFEKKFYNVSIAETARKGASVLKLRAFDPDEGSNIVYTISSGNDNDMFIILPFIDGALITLNGEPDFKSRSIYTLTVKATDDGGKFDTATVYIYIEDVNSPPYFPPHSYTVEIDENTPIGSTVAVVKAQDKDQGDNSRLVYGLAGAEGFFAITPDTGVITVVKELDREFIAVFQLKIKAIDHGNPPMSANTELEVVLKDVNDNHPEFENANYTVSISEDEPPGTSFFTPTAVDRDTGKNADLVYELDPKTNPNETFKIDGSSGTIRTAVSLDREKISHYSLTIFAKDKGTPVRTGRATLTVNILDVNDHPPRFEQPRYDLFIEENSPIGSKVGTVRAIDPDFGPNAKVIYRIFGGPDMGNFELLQEEEKVTIITRTELDFEEKGHYFFHLQASSGDLSSTTEIHVQVQDQNDNLPILRDFFVVVANYEHRFPPNPLGKIPASDPDVNSTLSYHIETNDILSLDSNTGKLSLNTHLNSTNRQLQAEFKTCVMDGANVVCAQCTLRYIQVTQEMLANSVTLRIRGISREQVLTPLVYSRLVDALSTLGPYDRNDVFLFSVQDDPMTADVKDLVVNASFSVRLPKSERFLSAQQLREQIHLSRKALSQVANLHILPFEDNLCVREPCVNFEACQNSLKFGAAPKLISTDDFLFRPIDPISTFTCVCPDGFASKSNQHVCDTEVNLCYSSPCRANGTCIQKENGYTCICPPNRTGAHCEFPIVTEFCLPGLCQGRSYCDASSGQITCKHCPFPEEFRTNFCELTTRSFTKEAYITLLTLKQRYRLRIDLSVSTVDGNGLILYNGRYEPQHDFIALRITDGIPEFLFSLGDHDITTVKLPRHSSNKIDDGKFHKITIELLNKTVTLSLDDCDTALALRFADQIGYPHCAVSVRKELPRRCKDRSVSCHRFLDLTGPLYIGGLPENAKSRISEPIGFQGCVNNLEIDKKLVDLSMTITNYRSKEGCVAMEDRCDKRPCRRSDQCMNVWNGYTCNCEDEKAGKHCNEDVEDAKTLQSADSYLFWKIPKTQPVPVVIGLSVRTRQRNTQFLLAEFNTEDHLAFTIIDGNPSVKFNSGTYTLPYPVISDGQWHTVEVTVALNHLNITVDYLYHKAFSIGGDIFYSTISFMSSGAAPGSKFAEQFLGCVKAAYMGRKYLKTKRGDYYHIGSHCEPADACTSNPCPVHSNCVQDWESFQCKCLPGYFGQKCVSVCSLSICQNGGTCQHFYTSSGYRCVCPAGFTGQYCQTRLPDSGYSCPSGWWGSPLCGPCKCDINKEFSPNCLKITGECLCKENHYKPADKNECFPCDCYPLGSDHRSCDMITGQCHCNGNIIGRKCDHCPFENQQINATSALCQVITKKCPERFDAGIRWPVANLRSKVTRSCPAGAEGLVSRFCDGQGKWLKPRLYDCTSKQFIPLQRTLSRLDAGYNLTGTLVMNLASKLNNATKASKLYGKDVYIGYRLILALLRFEMKQKNTHLVTLTHVQDKNFIKDLVLTSSKLFDSSNVDYWSEMSNHSQPSALLHLIHKFDMYGQDLAAVHQRSFLRSFQVNTNNIVFSVDKIDSSSKNPVILPKYNNFLKTASDRHNVFTPQIQIMPSGTKTPSIAFYGIYDKMESMLTNYNCSNCINSAIVSLALVDMKGQPISSLSNPVFISFPLINQANRSDPQCVWWEDSKGLWLESGCEVESENDTHVVCKCDHLSTITVFMRNTYGVLYFKSNPILRYLRPVCTGVSLLLLVISFVLLCCLNKSSRNTIRRKIHQAFIVTIIIHLSALFCVEKARDIVIACYVVSVMLHFASIALVAWLFLYILHWYRNATDLRANDQGPFWLFAVIGCQVPLVMAVATVFLSRPNTKDFCWFTLRDPYVWTMAIPVALTLLLSIYISVVCYLIASNKEWDILLAKLRLRSKLWHYFLVLFVTVAYIVFSWLSINLQFIWLHYTINGLKILLASVVFIWVVYLEQKGQLDLSKPDNLWLEGPSKTNGTLTIANVARGESPCLPDDMAPRAEEDSLIRQSSPALQNSNDVISPGFDKRYIMSPNSVNRSRGYESDASTVRMDDTLEPLIRQNNQTQSTYQKFFTKPDLIPSWEEQLNMASVPSSVESPCTPYSSTTFSTLSYQQSPSPLNSVMYPPRPPILSPVQKVLFDSADTRSPAGFQTFTPNRSARFETFASRNTTGTMPRRVEVNESPIRMIDEHNRKQNAETSL